MNWLLPDRADRMWSEQQEGEREEYRRRNEYLQNVLGNDMFSVLHFWFPLPFESISELNDEKSKRSVFPVSSLGEEKDHEYRPGVQNTFRTKGSADRFGTPSTFD